ncbi:MAG: hypothetical protein KC417_09420 [Myxococcales bacterium]|nr:hypothetical protein [Myxococcales bacterium]
MEVLPEAVRRLLWDLDPATLSLEQHRDHVMGRIMTRGSLEAMRWLRRTYSTAAMADFLERKGDTLAPRDLAYWSLIATGIPVQRAGGARPPWLGD